MKKHIYTVCGRYGVFHAPANEARFWAAIGFRHDSAYAVYLDDWLANNCPEDKLSPDDIF